MRWNISGADIPALNPALLYVPEITSAASQRNFPPCFLYAIATRETIRGQLIGLWPDATTVVSGDGGHGLFQLTDSWPPDWQDPVANGLYAIDDYLMPAINQWTVQADFWGETLVKCVAATFNAGFPQAWSGHVQGDVDQYTTHDATYGGYGSDVLTIYQALVAGIRPPGL